MTLSSSCTRSDLNSTPPSFPPINNHSLHGHSQTPCKCNSPWTCHGPTILIQSGRRATMVAFHSILALYIREWLRIGRFETLDLYIRGWSLQNQYRPPSSAPSPKRRRKEARKAVHPYANHMIHGTAPQQPFHWRRSGNAPERRQQ